MAAEANGLQPEDVKLREAIKHQRKLEQYCMWLNDSRQKRESAAVDWPPPTLQVSHTVVSMATSILNCNA